MSIASLLRLIWAGNHESAVGRLNLLTTRVLYVFHKKYYIYIEYLRISPVVQRRIADLQREVVPTVCLYAWVCSCILVARRWSYLWLWKERAAGISRSFWSALQKWLQVFSLTRCFCSIQTLPANLPNLLHTGMLHKSWTMCCKHKDDF